jgi:hypothetical protein
MHDKIVFVVCPSCKERFHIMVEDFAAHREAQCHCPFCHAEFQPRDHLEVARL